VRLVVAGRIERELPDQLAILAEDTDAKVVDQYEDPRPARRG